MKSLFALLLICCIGLLSGCTKDLAPTTAEHEEHVVIKFEDQQLLENFKAVCNQVGIKADNISAFEPYEDLGYGVSYVFSHNGWFFRLDCNADSTIESLYLGEEIVVFNKDSGAHHIDDYKPEEIIKPQVEWLAQIYLRQYFGIPEDVLITTPECYMQKDTCIYHLFGTVVYTDDNSEEQQSSFSIKYEHDKEADLLYRRYANIDGVETYNTMAEVKWPDRMPPVEQKSSS